jgi:hypothetical protein
MGHIAAAARRSELAIIEPRRAVSRHPGQGPSEQGAID